MLKKEWLIFVILILISVGVRAGALANVSSPFYYSFNSAGVLYEIGNMDATSSPYWWLNSGAKLIISNGTGKTIQGELSSNDKWRLIYFNSNPLDTDNGFHPQNVFRLITRSKGKNFQETIYFKINKDQLSASPNRDAHNRILLMSRYKDGDSLYYAGLRVDGNAIIKKKVNGVYYTLASKKIFSGTYNRDTNPNLLPKNIWIGLRSQINNTDGKTNIKVYMDKGKTGKWTLIFNINDSTTALLNEGYAGVRTDFMDVEFDDFRIVNV